MKRQWWWVGPAFIAIGSILMLATPSLIKALQTINPGFSGINPEYNLIKTVAVVIRWAAWVAVFSCWQAIGRWLLKFIHGKDNRAAAATLWQRLHQPDLCFCVLYEWLAVLPALLH